MAHRHIVADDRRLRAGVDVDDGAILDVAALADADEIGIAAQHAVKPHTRLRTDLDLADHRRRGRNEGIGGHARAMPFKGINRTTRWA